MFLNIAELIWPIINRNQKIHEFSDEAKQKRTLELISTSEQIVIFTEFYSKNNFE